MYVGGVTGASLEARRADFAFHRARKLLFLFLIVAQIVFAVAAALAYRRPPFALIASDGKGYYAWLRSITLDRDIDFRNDFALIYPPDPVPHGPITPRGLVADKYPVGVAITEAPGFLLGHMIAQVSGLPRDGVSAPYQVAVTLWLQALLLVALGVLWATLVRLGSDPMLAALGVASALSATNLVQYAAKPSMSHAPGIIVTCFALYFATALRDPRRRMEKLAAVGALLGLAAIIRPTNLALAAFFLPFLWKPLGRDLRAWAAVVAPFLAVVAIQVALASALWGRLQFQGYSDEGFTSGLHGIVATLFASRHGLFVYHPWYLLALGLTAAAMARRDTRPPAIGALVSFAVLTVANGTWWNWWFGDGFGNRAFIEVIPALLVPSVLWLSGASADMRLRLRSVASAVIVLSVVNAVLWTGFIFRRYPPDGGHSVTDAYFWFRR
jgi:hypothetical protein